jgi:hypothetical protein
MSCAPLPQLELVELDSIDSATKLSVSLHQTELLCAIFDKGNSTTVSQFPIAQDPLKSVDDDLPNIL